MDNKHAYGDMSHAIAKLSERVRHLESIQWSTPVRYTVGQCVYLVDDVASASNTLKLSSMPDWVGTDSRKVYLFVDMGNTQCEMHEVSAVTSSYVVTTLRNTTYSHNAGDPVLVTADPLVNVKYFGAKGDGATNDTVAITMAILQAQSISHDSTVFFPSGDYLTSSGYSIVSKVSLRGEPDWSSTLRTTATSGGDLLVFWAAGECGIYDMKLEASQSGSGSNTIQIGGNASDIMIDHCHFSVCEDWAIFAHDVNRLTIKNCHFTGVPTGISIGDGYDDNCENVIICNNFFSGINVGSAIYVGGSNEGVVINGNIFDSCTATNIYITGDEIWNISITGNIFRDMESDPYISITGSGSTGAVAIILASNSFDRYDAVYASGALPLNHNQDMFSEFIPAHAFVEKYASPTEWWTSGFAWVLPNESDYVGVHTDWRIPWYLGTGYFMRLAGYWSCTTNSGNVVLKITYGNIPEGTSATTLTTSTGTYTVAVPGTAGYLDILRSTAPPSFYGAGEDMIYVAFWRDAGNASDTATGDVYFYGMDVHMFRRWRA